MKLYKRLLCNNLRKKTMKASLTIEASFIYPIIIIFIMLTIIYCFYCHDKVAVKANAYTSLVKSYFNEETTYDKSNFEASLTSFCLLKGGYTCSYNECTKELSLMDNYGIIFNIGFSSFERCDFIRQYYCIIKQVMSQNDTADKKDERN